MFQCSRRLRWVRHLIFMRHVPSTSTLSSSHSHDYHVRCTISHSTSLLASFQTSRVGMMLDSWSSCTAKIHYCADNSRILFYTGGNSEYGLAISVPINMTGAFNDDFECPAHCATMFEFKYLPCFSLEDFLPLPLESSSILFSQSLRSPLCTGVVCVVFDPRSATIAR